MVRVDIRPRKRNSHRADADRRFPQHRQWVRGRPCLLAGKAGHVCSGPIEASHSDADGSKGMALKAFDFHVVPLCHGAQVEKDTIGRETWEAKYGVDHFAAGREYGRLSPHKWRWADIAGAPQ